jgi:hypothetical protein
LDDLLRGESLDPTVELAERHAHEGFHFAESVGERHLEPIQPFVRRDESLGDDSDLTSQAFGDDFEMSFDLFESAIQLLV